MSDGENSVKGCGLLSKRRAARHFLFAAQKKHRIIETDPRIRRRRIDLSECVCSRRGTRNNDGTEQSAKN
jgi:hypothetical protein